MNWNRFSDPRFDLSFQYPGETPGGQAVQVAEHQDEKTIRYHLRSSGSQEVYFEITQYSSLPAGEEYRVHRSYLEGRFSDLKITELLRTRLASLPAFHYRFGWGEGEREVVLIERLGKRILFIAILLLVSACNQSPMPLTASPITPAVSTLESSPSAPATQTPATETPAPRPHGERPLFLAHYMPWYQSPAVSGYWGWHWTMDHFQPDQKDQNGRPEIASHYTPLTGPYDSSDEALLEYQVLLMKLSGIDGVIVDWYGMENFWDYGVINVSTNKLFQAIQKAGLFFAICYEDQTIKHMVENKHLADQDIYTHGQGVMRYLQDTWFGQDAYLQAFDRPVLFIFGPQYFINPSDWESLFSVLDPRPVFVTLDNHPVPAATGSFPWPPMGASQEGVLSQVALQNYLNTFYAKAEAWDSVVAGAFPGFHDIYKEAGAGPGYGYLDAQQGKTFRDTLQIALNHNPDVVQLITWNDYGEGTIIEPAVEFEYLYLEMVQEARRSLGAADFPFDAEDLRLPLKLFQLRKKYARDATANARLDDAYQAILAGELSAAEAILASYP